MKTTKRLLFVAACLACATFAFGQNPEGQRSGNTQQKRQTPAEIAKTQTDELSKTLNLTEDQYKKVYKLNLSEETTRQNRMKARMEVGAGNRTNFGGASMGGGGGDDMGMGGGMGGGQMGGGASMGGQRGGGASQMSAADMQKAMEKDAAKKAEKMQKILTADQYTSWQTYESQRIEKMKQAMQQRSANGQQRRSN